MAAKTVHHYVYAAWPDRAAHGVIYVGKTKQNPPSKRYKRHYQRPWGRGLDVDAFFVVADLPEEGLMSWLEEELIERLKPVNNDMHNRWTDEPPKWLGNPRSELGLSQDGPATFEDALRLYAPLSEIAAQAGDVERLARLFTALVQLGRPKVYRDPDPEPEVDEEPAVDDDDEPVGRDPQVDDGEWCDGCRPFVAELLDELNVAHRRIQDLAVELGRARRAIWERNRRLGAWDRWIDDGRPRRHPKRWRPKREPPPEPKPMGWRARYRRGKRSAFDRGQRDRYQAHRMPVEMEPDVSDIIRKGGAPIPPADRFVWSRR